MARKKISSKPKTTAPRTVTRKQKKVAPPGPFPVVAIGASAGGVEASRELLKNLSDKLGMSYVFIHHLSPSHESHLPDILQRETSMPVHKVTNRLKVEANN